MHSAVHLFSDDIYACVEVHSSSSEYPYHYEIPLERLDRHCLHIKLIATMHDSAVSRIYICILRTLTCAAKYVEKHILVRLLVHEAGTAEIS